MRIDPPSLKSDRDRRGGQCAWGGSNFGTIDHPAASIKAVCVSELNGLPPSRSAAEIEGGSIRKGESMRMAPLNCFRL